MYCFFIRHLSLCGFWYVWGLGINSQFTPRGRYPRLEEKNFILMLKRIIATINCWLPGAQFLRLPEECGTWKSHGVSSSRGWANGQPVASPMILSQPFQLGTSAFYLPSGKWRWVISPPCNEHENQEALMA